MASEITFKIQLSASKGGAQVTLAKNLTLTMAGTEMDQGTQVIGTSAELVTFGEVATTGFLMCFNMDATNYVEFSVDASVATPFSRLNPGEGLLVPVSAVAIYAKAHTASVRIAKVSVDR